MKYHFVFIPAAKRELRKIDRDTAMVILQGITALGDDPYSPTLGIRKLKGREGLFRTRVGEYRVVYQVKGDDLIILVVKVGHRSDLYE